MPLMFPWTMTGVKLYNIAGAAHCFQPCEQEQRGCDTNLAQFDPSLCSKTKRISVEYVKTQ